MECRGFPTALQNFYIFNRMKENLLLLDKQLCFPFYAVSRLITKAYQPHLEKLGLTYPQYLVMLVLWEKEPRYIKDISKKLLLDTNTLTPLLKRMEKNGLLVRRRCLEDERSVSIHLTEQGKKLKSNAKQIPQNLLEHFSQLNVSYDELANMKQTIDKIITALANK